MKICVISTPVFQFGNAGLIGYGGLEHLAWQRAKGLAEKGHDVTLVAPEGSTCPGAKVIFNGRAGTWDERRAYGIYWKELLNFDVIIDETWNKWSYMLKAEGPAANIPILGVCHAPVGTMYQNPPPVPKPCIVCISHDQVANWKALHGRGDCRVCYNGVDLEFYRHTNEPRSDRYLFLARFSTIKGPDLAVKAAKQAQVGLDLVGDTSITQEPDFFNAVKAECNGSQIKMVGPASRGGCVGWFSRSNCLLHPNFRFREPFGLAPVEAMACGTPVLAFDFGAMRETVSHGKTGFLAHEFDDFVGYLMKFRDMDASEKQIMRENCIDWVSQFKLQNMIDRIEQLCIEALDTGGW